MNTEVYYYGIADSEGIESFILDETYGVTDEVTSLIPDMHDIAVKRNETLSLLFMRAAANPQRMAVVYGVLIKSSDAKEIQVMLSKGKYINALKFMKEKSLEIRLYRDPSALEYWNSIG
jgi:hypothetical protein